MMRILCTTKHLPTGDPTLKSDRFSSAPALWRFLATDGICYERKLAAAKFMAIERKAVEDYRSPKRFASSTEDHLPNGRFENSPPFQGWGCVSEKSSPEGTADVRHCAIQPSLRNLRNRQCKPGSKLPGYSRISLREAETATSPNHNGQIARSALPPVFSSKSPI